MELCERETIILINKADAKDGFFIIDTSCVYDARRIAKRLDLDIPQIPSGNAEAGYFSIKYKIPICYHSKSTLGVKNKEGKGTQGVKWKIR